MPSPPTRREFNFQGGKVTRVQGAKWQGYKVTGLQGDNMTRWQGYKVQKWQDDKVFELQTKIRKRANKFKKRKGDKMIEWQGDKVSNSEILKV